MVEGNGVGLYILGALAALLVVWFMIQAAEGFGYAFPRHPSAIDPARSRSGAQALIWIVAAGVILSLAVPVAMGQAFAFSPYHLVVATVLALPAWELMTADAYRGAILVVNADPDATRPAVIAAVSEVFGDVVDDKDMLVASDWEGDDFRLYVDERARLMVLNPTFRMPSLKAHRLMKTLEEKLKGVKAPGFNERSFWIAFVVPVALMALYGAITFLIFNAKSLAGLRGTLNF